MSGWISEAEISSRLGYKIILAGLSEAGKTAVKRVFFLGQGTEDVDSLAATINYERLIVNVRDTSITIVDLGGQRVFLKRFLGSFSPFIFSAVSAFLFLIDVENRATRNNAIEYFASCLEKLQKYSPNAKYFVFLHKNDLVRHLPNYESIHAQLKEQFQLESQKKLTFFRTTIYSPETVVNGFGRIFELAMPQLAESEYVGGRKIGQVEEYAERFITFRERKTVERPLTPDIVPKRRISAAPAPPGQQFAAPRGTKMAGDPTDLARIQGLMKLSLKSAAPSTALHDSAGMTDEAASLEKLQSLMKTTAKDEVSVAEPAVHATPPLRTVQLEEEPPEAVLASPEEPIANESDLVEGTSPAEVLEEHHLDLLHSIDEAFGDLEIEEEVTEGIEETKEGEQSRIDFLGSFYGIQMGEAKTVVESGYADVFEIGATSRIPIPVLLDVLLKYIPFLKSEGLDPSVLDSNKLLDILAAHLRGSVPEDDLLKCIIIAVKRIDLTIEEIIDKFFAGPVQTVRAVRGERMPVIDEPPEPIPPLPPTIAENGEGIIILPDSNGIGFRAELTPEQNCRLSFFNQKNPIGDALVSSTISRDELMYLLHFELQLPLEGGATSIYEAAKYIYSAIKEL